MVTTGGREGCAATQLQHPLAVLWKSCVRRSLVSLLALFNSLPHLCLGHLTRLSIIQILHNE